MSNTPTQADVSSAACRVVVIWIDWYAYHLARFRGLQAVLGSAGQVHGIELVGGVGVHKGYNFRAGLPEGIPVETMRPHDSWHETGKLSLSIALVRRLTALNPEVVLVPGYYTLPAVAAALWCRFKRRTSVLMTETTATDHVRVGWRERFKSRLIRTLFDWAVTGGTAHDRYLLQLGFPRNRIAHFYDVVGNAKIQDDVAELRRAGRQGSASLPSDYLLFVGRLSPEKNVVGLLKAWLQYRAAGGNWSLLLAGDGPEGDALKTIAQESAFAADVRFLGHRSARELLPIYAFAKGFVLPSTREPWGLVVNEAMAASLPVIVSNRCGCAEDLVQHGDNGFIFDPALEGDLAQCMTHLARLSEPERLQQGLRSLARIGNYSPQNFGQEIASIADSAANASGGKRRKAVDLREVSRGSA